MKLFLPLSVLVLIGLFTPNLLADPVLTFNVGTAVGTEVITPIVGGETWVYTDTSASLLFPTYVDSDILTVSFTDIAGVALLNVTDICANVSLFAPVNPCAGFAFSDTALGDPYLIAGTGDLANLDLAAAVDVNVAALGTDIAGVSIGNGTAQIGFGNPPGGGNPPGVTPEPPALTLLGTGLLGLAGVVKKRLFA